MEKLVGYARVLARARVKQQEQEPLIGQPHLKFGQCLAVWAYFFQLGGILGAKYSGKLDAFGPAFLGVQGEAGAVERFFTDVASQIVDHYLSESTTLLDYVIADSMKRLNYSGHAVDFFRKFGMEKIRSEAATDVAWQYAESGAALGAIYPNELRALLDRSHAVPRERWERARAAGVDIPQQQDPFSYEQVRDDEANLFMAYCHDCCPNLYAVLTEPHSG